MERIYTESRSTVLEGIPQRAVEHRLPERAAYVVAEQLPAGYLLQCLSDDRQGVFGAGSSPQV